MKQDDFSNLLPPVETKTEPAQKPNKPRIHAKAKPVFVRKLYDQTPNYGMVGKKIGLTANPVMHALRDDETFLTTELAAKAVYESENKESTIILTMVVTTNQYKQLKPWIEATQINFNLMEGTK